MMEPIRSSRWKLGWRAGRLTTAVATAAAEAAPTSRGSVPRRFHPALFAGAAAALGVGAIAVFWPGVVTYDGVAQFEQATTGDYDDWHPPILAHLWAQLHGVFGGGAGPMLVLQMALYWVGFALIATTLARVGKTRAAAAVLATPLLPLFLGWQAVVLKDTQMLGAVLAAVGIVAWWRLRGLRVPRVAWAGVAVLLVYATLVRANAAFATVPLVVMLAGPRRWWLRAVVALCGIAAVLGVAPAINHALLGAGSSGVERTEAIYDLAGIAVRAPGVRVGLPPDAVRRIAAKRCVKPFFWDPLGEPTRCNGDVAPLRAIPPATLYRMLARSIARAPLAYAAHRLAHLNATERWLVGSGSPSAVPPAASQPNALGLGSPGPLAAAWQTLAGWIAATPLGWPVAWVVLAVVGAVVAICRRSSRLRDLALALLVSALVLEASFAVLSIASDLRYHVWPMVATALASILLTADGRWPRRASVIGGAALGVVLVGGTVARVLLRPEPASYLLQLQ